MFSGSWAAIFLLLGQVGTEDAGFALPPLREPTLAEPGGPRNSSFSEPLRADPQTADGGDSAARFVEPAAAYVNPAAEGLNPPSESSFDGRFRAPADVPSRATGIAPAQAESSFANSPPEVKPAAALLQQALAVAPAKPLAGEGLTLRQAIEATANRGNQQATVAAYWRLALAITEFHFAAEESSYLVNLPVSSQPQQARRLDVAIAASQAIETTARVAVLEAQFEIAELIGSADTGPLRLATDLPLTGRYLTHFESLRSRGVATAGLRRLHVTLPALHEALEAQARALIVASEARGQLQAAYANGEATVDGLLELHHRVQHGRRDFLAAVGKYNQSVASYALSVAGPGQPAERIVGMLIATPAADRSVLANRGSPGIRRVSGEEAFSRPELAPISPAFNR